MRIRTQLIASAALAGFVVLWIGASLALVAARSQASLDEQSESQLISRQVTHLLSLTAEYTVYGGERATVQWRSRHAQLAQAVERVAERNPESPQLAELRHNIDDLPQLFDKLVEIGPEPKNQAPSLTQRRRDLLIERLLVETQEVGESRFRWAAVLIDEQRGNLRHYTIMSLAAPSALLVLLLSLGLFVNRHVLVPLARLEAAAAALQGGDLAARCASDARDELGDAARAVDAMARSLQAQSAALRASEHDLRLIANNLPAMISRVDLDERYTFVNAHVGRLLGLDERTLIGKTLREVRGDAAYGDIAARVAEALGGRTAVFEHAGLAQGRHLHYQSTYIPDLDDAGHVHGFYAMTADITERKEAELRQAASERRLVEITDNVPALVAYIDRDHCFRFANSRYLEWLGTDPRAMVGKRVDAAVSPQYHAAIAPRIDAALAGERVRWEREGTRDGKVTHYLADYIPDHAPDGSVRGFYALTIDITAEKRAQEEQARVQRQLRAITDNLPVLIAYIDHEERYGFLNATFKDWFGVEPGDALGRRMVDVIDPQAYAKRHDAVRRSLGGERVVIDLELTALGTLRSLHNIYVPDTRPDGRTVGAFVLSTDVTAMKAVELQLSQLARVDGLTDLPNRRQFEERLAASIQRAARSREPIALMFLDIDRFKSINDGLGHAAGDAVLKEFAARLRRSVRVTDTPARLAGDEFVVLLEGLHARHEAELVAEKVLAAIRKPFVIDGAVHSVTTSIGVAYCTRPDAETPMLARADDALYAAKAAGRNTFVLASIDATIANVGLQRLTP